MAERPRDGFPVGPGGLDPARTVLSVFSAFSVLSVFSLPSVFSAFSAHSVLSVPSAHTAYKPCVCILFTRVNYVRTKAFIANFGGGPSGSGDPLAGIGSQRMNGRFSVRAVVSAYERLFQRTSG